MVQSKSERYTYIDLKSLCSNKGIKVETTSGGGYLVFIDKLNPVHLFDNSTYECYKKLGEIL